MADDEFSERIEAPSNDPGFDVELTRQPSMSQDKALVAVEAFKARLAARSRMDEELAELKTTVSSIQRQSMSLSQSGDDMEKVKDVIRKHSGAINELKKTVTALEAVCKHLVGDNDRLQREIDSLNKALCQLAESD